MSFQPTFQKMIKAFVNFLVTSSTTPLGVNVSTNAPGSVGKRPFTNRAGALKLLIVCSSSLYIGGLIAHKGASYLEENEIFVPTDEDDDD